MEPTTTKSVLDLIPRQAAPRDDEDSPAPAGAAEHWLVRQLHEERRAADRARLLALLTASGAPTLSR